MLASTKKSGVRSTVSSSRASGMKKPETFMSYLFRKMKEIFMGFWMYSRKFLWISTTGTHSFS